jgi:hypothetical protein
MTGIAKVHAAAAAEAAKLEGQEGTNTNSCKLAYRQAGVAPLQGRPAASRSREVRHSVTLLKIYSGCAIMVFSFTRYLHLSEGRSRQDRPLLRLPAHKTAEQYNTVDGATSSTCCAHRCKPPA